MSAYPNSRFELLQNPHLKRKDVSSDEECDEYDHAMELQSLTKKHHAFDSVYQPNEQVCKISDLMPQKPPARAPIYSRWSNCLFGGDDF